MCLSSIFVFAFMLVLYHFFFFFKQKTAYEMRISDWSSDVCSSDLVARNDEIVPVCAVFAHRRGCHCAATVSRIANHATHARNSHYRIGGSLPRSQALRLAAVVAGAVAGGCWPAVVHGVRRCAPAVVAGGAGLHRPAIARRRGRRRQYQPTRGRSAIAGSGSLLPLHHLEIGRAHV